MRRVPRSAVLVAAIGGLGFATLRGVPLAEYGIERLQEDTCVGCHGDLHPMMVAQWRGSVHFRVGVGCEDCHGTDHERMFGMNGEVSAAACAGECHPEALTGFLRSKHSRPMVGLKADLLPRFTAVTANCSFSMGCHEVRRPFPDGSRGKCSVCHPSHAFSMEVTRDPATCVTCHSGSNNTEGEEYEKSIHGVLHRSVGLPSGPTCVTCHMPGGDHDDGAGITDLVAERIALAPAVEGIHFVPTMSEEEFDRRREQMLEACGQCHGRKLASRALEEADAFRRKGALMLEEAASIVHGLHEERLLVPMPEERRPNPTSPGLVLGAAQLFDEEMSVAERIFYRMYMFTYSAAWRRAYHNAPALVTWHENEMLKEELILLRGEARRLRGAAPSQ